MRSITGIIFPRILAIENDRHHGAIEAVAKRVSNFVEVSHEVGHRFFLRPGGIHESHPIRKAVITEEHFDTIIFVHGVNRVLNGIE